MRNFSCEVSSLKLIIVSPKNRTVYNFRGDLIKELVAMGWEVVVTGPNKECVERIYELGARFCEIPFRKNGINLLEDVSYLCALVRLFCKEKPDAVLSYTVKPVVYGSIAAWLTGVPKVASLITGAGYVFAAGTAKAKLLRFFVRLLYRVGLTCSDVVIFQNKDDMSEFVEHRLVDARKTCVVNGSGVNMDRFRKTDYPETLTFSMLARVMYTKGIREYLEAAKRVRKLYPWVRFTLLGAIENHQDAMPWQELKPYVDAGVVEYFGETTDVRPFLAQSSIFVLPSYREGTPRTVLEAMAMGRPIITTDAPGCRETVVDGYNGFLVPVGDVDALVEKMVWFVKNQDQIPIMGNASWDYCRAKFDVRKVDREMLECMGIFRREQGS